VMQRRTQLARNQTEPSDHQSGEQEEQENVENEHDLSNGLESGEPVRCASQDYRKGACRHRRRKPWPIPLIRQIFKTQIFPTSLTT
jgi:hypothetical protein